MGPLIGNRQKGPSLAQKTQDFYTKFLEAQQANKTATAAGTPAAQMASSAAQTVAASKDEELQKKAQGGFFGTASRGTFLGGGSGTFLG